MKRYPLIVAVLAMCLTGLQNASAVVSTAGGTASATATTEAWNYVGSIGGASGVYLGDYSGNYWVATAGHVGASTFSLGGHSYSYVPASVVQITNAGLELALDTPPSNADLVIYEITGSGEALNYLSSLTNLSLTASAPSISQAVTMVGYGGGKSWGTNEVAGFIDYKLNSQPYGGAGLATFDTDGVGVTGGDSGGGVFAYDLNGNLTLHGIMSANAFFTSGETSVEGMIAVDLSRYYNQIIGAINAAPIPEPATWAGLFGSVALLVTIVGRRRRLLK